MRTCFGNFTFDLIGIEEGLNDNTQQHLLFSVEIKRGNDDMCLLLFDFFPIVLVKTSFANVVVIL